jgi:hypothetical protein
MVTLVAHNAPSAEARQQVSRVFPWRFDPKTARMGIGRALTTGQVVQEPDIESDVE